MTRAFLIGASLPAIYWVDTVYAAVFTISRLPNPILHHKSLFQVLFQRMPNYKFLKPLGCACFQTLWHLLPISFNLDLLNVFS